MRKLFSTLLLLALAVEGQTTWNGIPNQAQSGPVVSKTFSLNQNAGTYTLFTATGGAAGLAYCSFQVSVTGTGLTSVMFESSDATPAIVLGVTLAANLVAGTNLNSFTGPLYMPSAGTINAVIVGNGTGGSIVSTCWYTPITAGATLT